MANDLRLTIVAGVGAGRELTVPEAGAVLGRDKQADIVLGEKVLSRRHCRICHQEGRWLLEDLGSRNGTFVNGSRATRAELKEGDVIQLGQTRLTVAAPIAAASPAEPKPAAASHVPRRRLVLIAGAGAAVLAVAAAAYTIHALNLRAQRSGLRDELRALRRQADAELSDARYESAVGTYEQLLSRATPDALADADVRALVEESRESVGIARRAIQSRAKDHVPPSTEPGQPKVDERLAKEVEERLAALTRRGLPASPKDTEETKAPKRKGGTSGEKTTGMYYAVDGSRVVVHNTPNGTVTGKMTYPTGATGGRMSLYMTDRNGKVTSDTIDVVYELGEVKSVTFKGVPIPRGEEAPDEATHQVLPKLDLRKDVRTFRPADGTWRGKGKELGNILEVTFTVEGNGTKLKDLIVTTKTRPISGGAYVGPCKATFQETYEVKDGTLLVKPGQNETVAIYFVSPTNAEGEAAIHTSLPQSRLVEEPTEFTDRGEWTATLVPGARDSSRSEQKQ